MRLSNGCCLCMGIAEEHKIVIISKPGDEIHTQNAYTDSKAMDCWHVWINRPTIALTQVCCTTFTSFVATRTSTYHTQHTIAFVATVATSPFGISASSYTRYPALLTVSFPHSLATPNHNSPVFTKSQAKDIHNVCVMCPGLQHMTQAALASLWSFERCVRFSCRWWNNLLTSTQASC